MVSHRKLEESDVKCTAAAPEAVAVFSNGSFSGAKEDRARKQRACRKRTMNERCREERQVFPSKGTLS